MKLQVGVKLQVASAWNRFMKDRDIAILTTAKVRTQLAVACKSKVKRHRHHGLWINGSLLLPCRESSTDHVCKEVVLRCKSGRNERD